MSRALLMAAGLLVSGCLDNPTETTSDTGEGAHPSFALSSTGIQALNLGAYPSRAFAINEAGLTVGSVDGNGIATVWTAPNAFTVVGPGIFSQFHDVNDQGEAVGYWNAGGGTIHAVRWTEAGGFQDIGTLRPGSYSYAHGINNHGQVVGHDNQGGARPFLWSPSTGMAALTILPGSINGIAFDINDAGTVVGESHAELAGINHAILWTPSGAVMDLGSLGGRVSTAYGINEPGQVVGWSMAANEEHHAFIWSESTGMVDLNTWGTPCAGASEAEAIDDAGQVVGACDGRPVIWTTTQGMRELGTPDGGAQGRAHDINSQGQVVGTFGYIGAALWIVNQPPVASAGGPYAGAEGATVSLSGTASFDPDPGTTLSYDWDFGDGSPHGSGPTPNHTYVDSGSYPLTLTVSDGSLTHSASTSAVIANVAPLVQVPVASATLLAVNTSVSVSAAFTDPGTADNWTGTIDWDDGTTPASAEVTGTNGAGSSAGTHLYQIPGVYTVTASVTDKDGGTGTALLQYIVVYDPAGGFVTGGGWITAPLGSYVADPLLTGKGSFGFISKYQKGASTPSGQTEFQFRAGSLNFSSTSYQWLVVSGAKAKYKGTGTVNGEGSYGFMLSAIDGALPGGGGTDKFRIKIWETTTEQVVFDNQISAGDDVDPVTTLGGGSIVIHKP